MDNTKEILKKNSTSLREAVGVADIADTDEIVSAIIDQKFKDSLAYQICDVQPMHGPTGAVFAVTYEGVTAQTQVNTVTVGSVIDSTIYTVTINGTVFNYASDADATEAEIVTGLVTAINIGSVQQVDTLSAFTVANSTAYTVTVNTTPITYNSDIDALESEILIGLALAINGAVEPVSAEIVGSTIEITADVSGTAFTSVSTTANFTATNTVANVASSTTEPVTATDNTTNLTLDADVSGVAFTIAVTAELVNTPTTANIAPRAPRAVVKRNNVTVEDDALENTGFTLEAIQDIQRQFGKDAINFISKVFSGVSAAAENVKILAELESVGAAQTALALSASANAETNVFEISQKVAESILAINSKNYRTYDTFVVLPLAAAAAFLALGTYFSDAADEAGLFIGHKGRIKYYVNPDPAADTCYVGLNSKTPGCSSLVFSPFQHTLLTAVDPDTGDTNVFNINRYAITENALSEAGNEMVHKFVIS